MTEENQLEEYTDKDLKAAAYDIITGIETDQQRLQMVQEELQRRNGVEPVETEEDSDEEVEE
jgi:hypothetical protein